MESWLGTTRSRLLRILDHARPSLLQWDELAPRAQATRHGRALFDRILHLCQCILCPTRMVRPKGAPRAAIFVPFHAFQLNSDTWISATGAWIVALILILLEALLFAWLQWRELQKLLTIAPQS